MEYADKLDKQSEYMIIGKCSQLLEVSQRCSYTAIEDLAL